MSKLISQPLARNFIHHYQNLLIQVAEDTGLNKQAAAHQSVVELLHAARNVMAGAPELLAAAQIVLKKRGAPISPEIMRAVATLRVDRWIYLRDTASHSVLLDVHNEDAAYAIKCLTTPFKEMLGGSGAFISCGLLVYEGQVISDGLLGFESWIGADYRRDFNAELSRVRANGCIYSDRILPASRQADEV